jgi:hypothetical protein
LVSDSEQLVAAGLVMEGKFAIFEAVVHEAGAQTVSVLLTGSRVGLVWAVGGRERGASTSVLARG